MDGLDKRAIREMEEVLGTKIYPGTEIMRDISSRRFVKTGGLNDVLVPQPSNDPKDPLNWSPLWKGITIFCATLLSFSLNFGPLALAPMFGDLMKEFPGHGLADVIQFTAVAILVLGFSNFLWVPIMSCFGRRPVMIFSSLICVFSSIWRAKATTYNSFMGASILNGIAAGPCETAMPQIIADIIFLKDRGKFQTLYFSTYFSSLMIGPIISGAMSFHWGYRSFWWFNTALLGFTFATNLLLFPETRYTRRTAPTPTPAYGRRGVSDEDLAKYRPASANSVVGIGGPGASNFLPAQGYAGNLLRELWLPLYLHLFPIAEFAAFVVSFSASGFLFVNLTQSQAFAAPPYNFSSQTIGFFNFALLAGALIGLSTSGPLSDWVAARLTRKNGGVREPEMRLVTMIPYVLIMIAGSFVVAVGYDYHWPWQVIVMVGYTCMGMQVAALPSISSTYAIDSYKPVTGSLFVMITINKNVWGYGMGQFITPWSMADGFIPPIMLTCGLITFFCLCGIVFWFMGKYFRGLTKDSFVHQL